MLPPRSVPYLVLIQQPSPRDIIATSPGIALIINETRRNLRSTISQDHACNRDWILIHIVRAFFLAPNIFVILWRLIGTKSRGVKCLAHPAPIRGHLGACVHVLGGSANISFVREGGISQRSGRRPSKAFIKIILKRSTNRRQPNQKPRVVRTKNKIASARLRGEGSSRFPSSSPLSIAH